MADLSKITLPNNTVYNLRDAVISEKLEIEEDPITDMTNLTIMGLVWTKTGRNTVSVYGSNNTTGTRRYNIFYGQSRGMTSSTSFVQMLPAGAYKFEWSVSGYVNTIPSLAFTYSTYTTVAASDKSGDYTFLAQAPFMFGFTVLKDYSFGTQDNPTIITFNVKKITAVDSEARMTKMPIVDFGEETVLVNTTTVSFSKDGDNDWYVSGDNPLSGFTYTDFSINNEYKITWDGTDYTAYCRKSKIDASLTGDLTREWGYIGNVATIGWASTKDDDEALPFCIAYNYDSDSNNIIIFSYNTASSHTIKISKTPFTLTLVDPILYKDTDNGTALIRKGTGEGSIVIGGWAKDASGEGSAAMGEGSIATGINAFAFGKRTVASGNVSATFGARTIASGIGSFAFGSYYSAYGYTTASGNASLAGGVSTQATGNYSVALGQLATASGSCAVALNDRTIASGTKSFAAGVQTIANHNSQFVFGQCNIADTSTEEATAKGNYIEIVGNGTSDTARSNARTLDWSGNETLAGKLTLGAAPTANMDAATKQYVDSLSLNITGNVIQLKQGTTIQSSITLPVYNGGVS